VKPLFTIHAAELLVSEFMERNFRSLNVWVPAKDTRLDLLVTGSDNQKAVSLQVKFSRDFLATHMKATLQLSLRACGWWRFSRKQIGQSKARLLGAGATWLRQTEAPIT
jgi:hypothetical protein